MAVKWVCIAQIIYLHLNRKSLFFSVSDRSKKYLPTHFMKNIDGYLVYLPTSGGSASLSTSHPFARSMRLMELTDGALLLSQIPS